MAAQEAQRPAEPSGEANPVVALTIRTPGAASQRAISPVSSSSAPPSGAGWGSTTCAAARSA
ncbi:MAG TPA: hypothetical protein PL146_16930, partial [Mycobacterium sp.]|nr:hypothetical protein [Mycobacterium sp.]